MKKQTTTFALTSIILCLFFSEVASSQVNWSCRNVYSSSKLMSNEPYPNFENIKSNDLKNIETKISDLETKMRPLGFKKTSLEREAEATNIFIPYYLRTPKLKETEDKLRTEKLDLEREERLLSKLKEDKEEAILFLEKNGKGNSG